LPVALPRAASARTVASPTSLSQFAPSAAMPDSSTRRPRSRRIFSAIWSVQAAWITGTRPTGTTNTVRRIPSIRTRVAFGVQRVLDVRLAGPGAGPGRQVDRRRVGAVQPDDVGHGAYQWGRHRGGPGRETVPGRQPRPPLGHADRPHSAPHDDDPTQQVQHGYLRTMISFRHPAPC